MPKTQVQNPVNHVIQKFTLLTAAQVMELSLIHHSAMNLIVNGKGSRQEWEQVTNALNLAQTLDDLVFQRAYEKIIFYGLQAQARTGLRLHRTHRLGFSGRDLTDVNLALEVHDQQLAQATIGDINEAREAVWTSLYYKKNSVGVEQLAAGKYEHFLRK